jgi:hypothetical protein
MRLPVIAFLLVPFFAVTVPLLGFRSAAQMESCADATSSAAVRKPDPDGRTLLFDQFLQPLVEDATRRRATLAKQDPQYADRVDQTLNQRRINVALLGYGEEHDQDYADMGVSVTVLSINLDTWDIASISLSRDIRAPELEDQSVRSPPRWPVTLRAAFRMRGFAGVRNILEDATGLSIDYQVLMKDVFLRNYLNDVSGPVELIVPQDFYTNVYRLDGVEHEQSFIPAGRQTLSQDMAMTFVLGESIDPHGRADERSYRKDLLLKTLSCQVRQKFSGRDVGFALNLLRFSVGELKNQDLTTDFDFDLIARGLANLAQAFIGSRGDTNATFPQLSGARELVIHDASFGDGGVRRVHNIASSPDDNGVPDNPLVKQEIEMGSLGRYMLIPIGGNPYATDLLNEYWPSVRSLVRTTLVSGGPP